MSDPRPSQAERQEQTGRILGWVGGRLLTDIGPDWARVDLKVSMAANVDDYLFATLNPDGSVRERELPVDAALEKALPRVGPRQPAGEQAEPVQDERQHGEHHERGVVGGDLIDGEQSAHAGKKASTRWSGRASRGSAGES